MPRANLKVGNMERWILRGLTRLPMEDMAHPASAPAAPVAVLTSPPGTGSTPPSCSLTAAVTGSVSTVSGYHAIRGMPLMRLKGEVEVRTIVFACSSSFFTNNSTVLKA